MKPAYTVFFQDELLGWIVALRTDDLYTVGWFTEYLRGQDGVLQADFVGW